MAPPADLASGRRGWHFWRFIADHIAAPASFHLGLLCAEFILTIVVVAVDPAHMNHFTWWGLVAYGIYAGAAVFFPPRCAELLWGVSATVSCVILFGVLALSVARCSLLQDALNDLGGSGYLLGNFGVHYWPMLRLYFSRPSQQPDRFWNGTFYGLSFPVVYLSMMDASDVYGCRIPENAIVRALPTLVLVSCVVRYVSYPRQHDAP